MLAYLFNVRLLSRVLLGYVAARGADTFAAVDIFVCYMIYFDRDKSFQKWGAVSLRQCSLEVLYKRKHEVGNGLSLYTSRHLSK